MNKDLPFFSDTIPFLLQNDEIRWSIGFIRKILEEIPMQVSCPLTREENQLFFFYQKEKKQQLEFLSAVESYIEQTSLKTMQYNTFINSCVITSKKHASKQEIVQTEGIEETRKTNQSFDYMNKYHELTRIFCALVSCSAYAMFLQCQVSAISNKKTYEMSFEEFEHNKQMIDHIKQRQEQTFKIIEQTNKNQEEIKADQKELKKLMINRNEIDEEKIGTLSIEQCIVLIRMVQKHYYDLRKDDCEKVGLPSDTVKVPTEKTIRRYVEFWDLYLKGDKKRGRKPPRNDYSRNMSMEDYSKLIKAVELDKYDKWRARNKIYERSKV